MRRSLASHSSLVPKTTKPTRPRPFPKTITIDLPDFQQGALEEIAEREHFEDHEDLLKVVISKGIVSMLERDMARMTSEASFPFDPPGKRYQERRRKMLEEIVRDDPALSDVALSDTPGWTEERPVPHHHIPDQSTAPLQERLRISLQDWLLEHGHGMTDEEAFQLLLDLGLRHAAGETPAQVIMRVRKDARRRRLAERE